MHLLTVDVGEVLLGFQIKDRNLNEHKAKCVFHLSLISNGISELGLHSAG
jgi:hypothetical protein